MSLCSSIPFISRTVLKARGTPPHPSSTPVHPSLFACYTGAPYVPRVWTDQIWKKYTFGKRCNTIHSTCLSTIHVHVHSWGVQVEIYQFVYTGPMYDLYNVVVFLRGGGGLWGPELNLGSHVHQTSVKRYEFDVNGNKFKSMGRTQMNNGILCLNEAGFPL